MIQIRERVKKLKNDLQALCYPKEAAIPGYRMYRGYSKNPAGENSCCEQSFDDIANLCTDGWEELSYGQLWGGHREYFWFDTTVQIPGEFDGQCVVYELLTGKEGEWDATNPQFTVYVNGRLRQGFDVNHRELVLAETAKAGDSYRIVLSAFTGDSNFSLFLNSRLRVLDRKTEKYFYDISVPFQAADLLENEDMDRIRILTALNESLNLVDFRKPHSEAYYESLEKAQRYLTEEFYEKYCGGSKESVYCVGHTHIDVAWKWTLAVTEDKAVRSFSTVLELMREYPEYIFMSSQPQLYKYVKKNAPEVYEEIKERVKEGRWETDGGMWVEADCNLSSGESLVRQFLYGQRFFREEFGKENCMLWLPDVFGYSAALPQIMQKCGLSYFMTTKINWNEFNRMPYDTFLWEGIDGSRVLTHFIPTRDYKTPPEPGRTDFFTTYNGTINASQIKGGWERYSQKYLNGEVLNSFGHGDGGGGATREMLENYRRLAKGIPGCPQAKMSTARHFFEVLESHVKDNKYLPSWVGELYLEYHRGTYTSMARNKKYNRKSEYAYENLETYSMMNRLWNKADYPEEMLKEGWEVILRNQFHDILPGSSIREVYEDSREEYEGILEESRNMTEAALGHIVSNINAPAGSVVVFNPNSAPSSGLVTLPDSEKLHNPVVCDGEKKLPVQKTADDFRIFYAEGVPAKGYKTYMVTEAMPPDMQPGKTHIDEAEEMPENMTAGDAVIHAAANAEEIRIPAEREPECPGRMEIGTAVMENDFFRVEYNEKGQFARIFDKKAEREVLKPGQAGNVIVSYEDRPHNYDAWDINNYYTEKSWEVGQVTSMEVTENGPVRGCVRIVRNYLDSVITQYVYLYRDIPRIDIRNVIDWKEHQILLKDYFPVDVHANEAVFEIQYGNVTRNTHDNTSWDFAKFEVCHHKWLDVSENGYGVSILNDCKYGVSVRGGLIGLSMLKSPIYPNPDADKEMHEFTYSIYPHRQDWREAGTVQQAYRLNNPLTAAWKENGGGVLDTEYSFVSSNQENAVIEVVKKAEDSDEVIVRLYECYNRRTPVTLTFGKELASAAECNMLEEEERSVGFEGNTVSFMMRPYEIKTIKVSFSR